MCDPNEIDGKFDSTQQLNLKHSSIKENVENTKMTKESGYVTLNKLRAKCHMEKFYDLMEKISSIHAENERYEKRETVAKFNYKHKIRCTIQMNFIFSSFVKM